MNFGLEVALHPRIYAVTRVEVADVPGKHFVARLLAGFGFSLPLKLFLSLDLELPQLLPPNVCCFDLKIDVESALHLVEEV